MDRPHSDQVEFVHRSWPAEELQLSAIRASVRDWLAPLGLTDAETADIVLAVDEAAANAVEHAYAPGQPGTVELTLWTEHDALCIEITDQGSWRAPGAPAACHGWGIPLMHKLVGSVLIHYDTRGSRVLLRHPMPTQAVPRRDMSDGAAPGKAAPVATPEIIPPG